MVTLVILLGQLYGLFISQKDNNITSLTKSYKKDKTQIQNQFKNHCLGIKNYLTLF